MESNIMSAARIEKIYKSNKFACGSSDCGISDLSVLLQFQNLTHIDISPDFDGDAQRDISMIRDVSPLEQLPHLRSLKVDFNGDDLSCFSGLKQIKSLFVDLQGWKYDLSPLSTLTQLEELSLSIYSRYYPINYPLDITPLSGLVNLAALHFNGHNVTLKNFAVVKKLTQLRCLDCQGSHIRTLKPLEKLIGLEELNVADNALRDIRPLGTLTNLKSLHLGGTKVIDISPLAGLRKLSWLCLSGLVTDLSPLSQMQSLRKLYLDGYNSQISRYNSGIKPDISPLSGLHLDVLEYDFGESLI
jgi:Leucine-rich repeat (LRR) protein